MLTKHEEDFIQYWEKNRNTYNNSAKQWLIAIPLALALCIATMLVLKSGWYERADMVANSQSSPVIIFLAFLVIIVFIGIFTRRFKWETNEQRYKELMAKKEKLK